MITWRHEFPANVMIKTLIVRFRSNTQWHSMFESLIRDMSNLKPNLKWPAIDDEKLLLLLNHVPALEYLGTDNFTVSRLPERRATFSKHPKVKSIFL